MVLPGLEGILLHYFGEMVFGARLSAGNKGFWVPTRENSGSDASDMHYATRINQ